MSLSSGKVKAKNVRGEARTELKVGGEVLLLVSLKINNSPRNAYADSGIEAEKGRLSKLNSALGSSSQEEPSSAGVSGAIGGGFFLKKSHVKLTTKNNPVDSLAARAVSAGARPCLGGLLKRHE